MGIHDQVGFLPKDVDFHFSFGELTPMSSHALVEKAWKIQAHPDGYVYPPYGSTFRVKNGEEAWQEIPNSGRAAHLHRIPCSHDLFMEGEENDKANLRRGMSGFIIQFVGFLYGYRVQFFDWWVDGRVKIKSQAPYSVLPTSLGPACINQAIDTWQGWDLTTQRIITNALFMFSRSEIFEFGWERFMVEYMVLDATYKAAVESKAIQPVRGHKARLNAVANSCGISFPPSDRWEKVWDEFFVDLRNNLFHEIRWDGDRIIGSPGTDDAELAPYFLHEFTRRALLRVLGIKGPYLATPWWTFGTDKFDVVV